MEKQWIKRRLIASTTVFKRGPGKAVLKLFLLRRAKLIRRGGEQRRRSDHQFRPSSLVPNSQCYWHEFTVLIYGILSYCFCQTYIGRTDEIKIALARYDTSEGILCSR
jgi:hypothetical protein